MVEFNLLVGGEAGQGVQSVGFLLAKAFARGGYHVFADQDYESRIRGGHNFFRVRIKDSEVGAISEKLDVLVALNRETITLHAAELVKNGTIIHDAEDKDVSLPDTRMLPVPFTKLAVDKGGNKIMANSVALGAAAGLVGYKFEILSDLIKEHFGSGPMGEGNVKAVLAGYEFAQQNFAGKPAKPIKPLNGVRRMLITGNEAISLGALAADCKFMAAYPMTPSTSIIEYLAAQSEGMGIAVVQPEDEIAAANMIVGAAFAGVRSMTATSGSGFCLMTEALGLAGITETPVVMINSQRPGPAVGLPTRTEQGDLLFVIHAHQGDFPRAVLAPATVEDAFWMTVKAFNLADKYQIPVVILNDQHLASSYSTVDKFDLSKTTIDRGVLYSGKKEGSSGYLRHSVTETGISPRAFPGDPDALVVTDADEHNEAGHLIEDARTRTEQMQKRLRKMVGLRKEISPPQLYGPKDADTTLIGWGSTYGAIREAVSMMLEDGASINMLHFSELWPFPADSVASLINKKPNCFVVENNATAQLARLIKQETGKSIDKRILKFDGRPLYPEEIITGIKGAR